MTDECQLLLDELLDLRRAVAQTLGRDQYMYRLVDEALQTHHGPTMARAREEFLRQADDVKQYVLGASQLPG